MEANGGEWAEKSGWGVDKANEWRTRRTGHGLGFTSGRVGGLKGALTSLPISLSCAQTTCLTAERVSMVLESAVGSILDLGFTLSRLDHLPHCSASVQGVWE